MSPVDPGQQDALAAIDGATNRLAISVGNVSAGVDGVSIRVDKLVQALSLQPTPAEVSAFKDAMNGETTKLDAVVSGLDALVPVLNGIAADPVNPVPIPVPDPLPVPPEA